MVALEKLQKLANIIVNYSLELKKGENVLLSGYGFDSYPLVKEVYRECVRKGAQHVNVQFGHEELGKIFYEEASKEQLQYFPPWKLNEARKYDCMVQIVGESSPYELKDISPKKIVMRQKATKKFSDILHETRWLLFYYPNISSAQKAQKNLEDWENFVFDSCIQDWKKEAVRQEKFMNVLKKADKIRVIGKETDLVYSVKKQPWVSCSGKRNLPDGEVFTSPIKNSVEGHIRFNVPTHYHSKDFDWIKLYFQNGKVIKEESSDTKSLTNILNTDKGARYVGEVAFGLNKAIREGTRQIIFDEKMGKSMHMALGKCFKEEAPNGNDSNIHWDMIFHFGWAKATIYFDKEKVFEKGKWIKKELRFLN